MARHIITGSGAPTSVPTEISMHYADLVAGKTYISTGIDSSADWIEVGSGSGSGSTTYLGLTDTPSAFSGSADAIPSVNTAGTAITFADLRKAKFESVVDPAHAEGLIYYSSVSDCFVSYTDVIGKMRLGRSVQGRGINKTGSLIPKGTVVILGNWNATALLPEIEIADNTDIVTASKTIAITPYDIDIDAEGEALNIGVIIDLDTSPYEEGDVLWAGTAGTITKDKPSAPYYPVRIGLVALSHESAGIIVVAVDPFTASDTGVNADGLFNGTCMQKQGVNFTVDTGVIYADVTNEQTPGLALPFMIGGKRYDLDTLTGSGTSGAARVALTAGADANTAQINFIYVDNSPDPTLKSSTTFPFAAKAWVGIASVFDVATTNTDGVFSWQRFNNAVDNGDGDGALNYITEKLRKLGATYQSGVDPTITINTGSTPNNVTVSTTSGTTWQLHLQTFEAKSGNTYYVINDPDGGIKK